MSATRSALDSSRFGIEVYRAAIEDLGDIPPALGAQADLLILRCPVARLDLAQALEAKGALLCDTLIEYRGPSSVTGALNAAIRLATPTDRAALELLARASFGSFLGHYHQDRRLDPEAATEGYVEWCLSSLLSPSDAVLVAEADGQLVGFLTAKLGKSESEILLNGVSPAHQRQGWYGALFDAISRTVAERSIPELVVSTQLSNWAPQKVWLRRGLEPTGAQYTFHRWSKP